jgi:hypothetical protein
VADVKKVQPATGPINRESELAMGHVRTSSAIARVHPYLRKMAALIHRDEAVGIIAQRIIGSDSVTNQFVNAIVAAMWLDTKESHKATIGGGIELFGWPIIREIAIVALLHQVHDETVPAADMNPLELDRAALAVLTCAVEMGADSNASLLANVGVAGLWALFRDRYYRLRRSVSDRAEDLAAAERDEFGFDHAVLGAAMLWEADFPDQVCRLVLSHGAPTSPIWISEQLACQLDLGAGLRSATTSLAPDLCLKFGMTARRLIHIQNSMISASALPTMHFTRGAARMAA